jgi:hypothetical protein
MHWLSDFAAWFTSDGAQPIVFTAILLVLAVIVAGVLAAWISRGALNSVITRTERQQKASAIATLIDAATEASVWHTLSPQEQLLSDRAVGQADTLVRLLPVRGASIAANWATHQLAQMKRNSAVYGHQLDPQLDPAVAELRDRLIEWQYHPRRVRKTFQEDLDRWAFEYEANAQDREAALRSAELERPAQAEEIIEAADASHVAVPVPEGIEEDAGVRDEVNPGMLPTGPEAG